MLKIVLSWILATSVRFGALLSLIWLYKELTMGICRKKRSLKGQRVLLTGGNSGIGLETAKELASLEAEVIITCRTREKCEKAKKEIFLATGVEVHAMILDISCLETVRGFVTSFTKEYRALDYLINNAGLAGNLGRKMMGEKEGKREVFLTFIIRAGFESPEGHELIIATNYLGPVLLTELLLPHIKAAEPNKTARVIHISSIGECAGFVYSEDDLSPSKSRNLKYDSDQAYLNSKLGQALYSSQLAQRLRAEGSSVESVALHPGLVRTEIFRNSTGLVRVMIDVFKYLIGKSPLQGCQTTLEAVLSEEKLNGKFLSDCRELSFMLHPALGDRDTEQKLWQDTKEILSI